MKSIHKFTKEEARKNGLNHLLKKLKEQELSLKCQNKEIQLLKKTRESNGKLNKLNKKKKNYEFNKKIYTNLLFTHFLDIKIQFDYILEQIEFIHFDSIIFKYHNKGEILIIDTFANNILSNINRILFDNSKGASSLMVLFDNFLTDEYTLEILEEKSNKSLDVLRSDIESEKKTKNIQNIYYATGKEFISITKKIKDLKSFNNQEDNIKIIKDIRNTFLCHNDYKRTSLKLQKNQIA